MESTISDVLPFFEFIRLLDEDCADSFSFYWYFVLLLIYEDIYELEIWLREFLILWSGELDFDRDVSAFDMRELFSERFF